MDDLLNISSVSADESEDEHLTSAQVLEKLEEAWINERLSPNLMECKAEIVECVIEQLQEMEDNILRAKKGDLKISFHHLELDRIRYVLSSYLRCRLEKIEKHAPVFLKKDNARSANEQPRMSPEEHAFANELVSNMETYMKSVALKHLPRTQQHLALDECVPLPDLDHYVFLKVNRNEDGVIVDSEMGDHGSDRVDLEKGAQHLMRYKPVATLVESGAVTLM